MKTPDQIVSNIIDNYAMGYPEVARDQGAKDIKTFADQETASLRSEIAQLRSRLDECRRQKLTGSRI